MISQILKFNKNLYHPKSVREAVKEFQSSCDKEVNFKIKQGKDYVEVIIASRLGIKSDLINEFSNYALFLNLK